VAALDATISLEAAKRPTLEELEDLYRE